MEPKKLNRTNIGEHLLDYQLNIIGKTRMILIDDDKWFIHNTLTRQQYDEFRKYAVYTMQKIFKCNRLKAENAFDWFYQQFGLKLKN